MKLHNIEELKYQSHTRAEDWLVGGSLDSGRTFGWRDCVWSGLGKGSAPDICDCTKFI